MAKIKDVAKLANTSISTVSRVLNGSANVKPDTKKRILSAIEELGYKPLVREVEGNISYTNTIGLIVPDIENPFFGKMTKIMTAIFDKYGYNTLLINIDSVIKNNQHPIDSVKNKVDGLVYASSYKYEEIINKAKELKLPIVIMDREIRNMMVSSVAVNNEYAGYIATKHLVDMGHKRIAFFGGPETMQVSYKRMEGYKQCLIDSNLEVDEELIVFGDFRMNDGYNMHKSLVEKGVHITAILAANDLMGIGAINYCNHIGLRVPRDMSVVGFDDIDLACSITPNLTTISYPLERMGELAIKAIIDQMNNKNKPQLITLYPELIKRESTGKSEVCPKGSDYNA
ncbi:LacI family DNA-binding transcriptional regulator [Clostridiaceae bacterium M8S5]|nr:LacI family DNA-binding transcriptional regulator [Clostridiaceae bacterium M8S5]